MQKFHPGYAMHPIHGRRLAETPWGWRPATIASVDGLSATAAYLDGAGTVSFWHASPVDGLEIGLPVRVHEQLHAVEVDDAWVNVRIDAGVGPVPAPEHPELWADQVYGVLVNAATGDGIRISSELMRRFRPRP